MARENVSLNARIVAEAVEPFDVRFMPEPSQLPLRVMTNVKLCLFDRAKEVTLTSEMLNHPPVTVRAQRV